MFKKSLAMAILVAGLTACSGGGSSASHSGKMADNAKQTNKQTNKQIDHNSSQSSSPHSNSKALYGGDYALLIKEKDKEKSFVKPIKSVANIAQLTIEGKTLEMLSKNAKQKIESKPFTYASLDYYDHSNSDHFGNLFVVVRGELTPLNEMPKSGVVSYKGDVLGLLSSFKVDFGRKTVNGELLDEEGSVKLPESRIEGNTFRYADAKEEVRGHFFGKNAAELGGVWNNNVAEKVRYFIAAKQ